MWIRIHLSIIVDPDPDPRIHIWKKVDPDPDLDQSTLNIFRLLLFLLVTEINNLQHY